MTVGITNVRGLVPPAGPRRYKVDLAGQMACCEANYARLLKLLPGLDGREMWHYDVQAGQQSWPISLRVTERARYTTMLELTLGTEPTEPTEPTTAWSAFFPGGMAPRLQVRLYHDASMAEVVAWSGHRHMQPRYEYPNRQMYQQDEKAQLNRFLSDWLIHSLAHGQVREPLGYP